MNVQSRKSVFGFEARETGALAERRPGWRRREQRQFSWMVAAVFVVLLVPAAIGWLTRWSWQPWPPGRDGYRSIVGETKEAAQTYVSLAFLGW